MGGSGKTNNPVKDIFTFIPPHIFQSVIENSLEGICVINDQLFCTYVNNSFCTMLGFSEQEILAQKITSFFFEENLDEFSQRMENRRQKISEIYEQRFRRKDGNEIWMSVSATPLLDEIGETVGSFARLTDITEQKKRFTYFATHTDFQAKLAGLDNIEQVYQLLGQKIHEIIGEGFVGTAIVDEESGQARVASVHGVTQLYVDVVKKLKVDPEKIIYPINNASAYEQNVFQSKKLTKFEGGLYSLFLKKIPKKICSFVEKQFHLKHIAIMGMNCESECLGIVGIFTEKPVFQYSEIIEALIIQAAQVIRRLNSELKNRINEERLKITFNALEDGYWDWDLASGKVIVSDQWYIMLGYLPNEFPVTLETFLKMTYPDDLEKTSNYIEWVKANPSANYNIELRLRTKTGEYKSILSRGKIITSPGNDKMPRMVGTHSDISERKRIEQDKLLFDETQRKLLQIYDLNELYDLIGTCISKLLPDGYMIFTRFDDPNASMKIVRLYGFEKANGLLPEKFIRMPSKISIRMDENSPEENKLWQSGSLVRFNGGLYELTKKKMPRQICRLIEKRLSINQFFVMGCKWNEQRYGGLIIFTRDGLGRNQEYIETLINETAIALQRIMTQEESFIVQTRFKSIFEQSPVGITTIDRNLKYLSMNQEYSNITGYSQDELFRMTFKEVTHPDDVETEIENMGRIIAGKLNSYNALKRFVRKDGQIVWTKLLINKICDPNGNFLYLLAMFMDISKEVAAEQATFENRRFLELVLDTIPNLVFVRDSEGQYHLTNKAFAESMGSTPKEIVGKTEIDLRNSTELVETIRQQDLEVIATGKEWKNSDLEITFPNAGKKYMQLVKCALPYFENEKPAVLGVLTDLSERKKNEQAIRDSELKYRTLYESMRQGAFYQLADGKMLDVNQAALNILGVTREEFLSDKILEIKLKFAGEDGQSLDYFSLPSFEVLKTGQPVYEKIINIINSEKGSDVWVVVNAIPQFKENEIKPYQVFVTLHDISPLKQIEKELLISEVKYRTLVQQSPAGVYQTNSFGEYTYFNDKLCQMNGFNNQEMMGEGWKNGIYIKDRERISHFWDSFIKNGGKWSFEYRIQNQKSGQITWVFDEAVELLDDDGGIIGYIGSKFNLDELKNTESKLRKSEEKYRLLTENMKDIVWTLDTESMGFTYMSPSVENLRGYTAQEVMSSPLSAALTEEGAREFIKIIHQQILEYKANRISSKDFFTYEIPQPKKDGTMVWTEVTTSMHTNPDTGHLELHGVTRDITDRKQAEEALRKSEEKHRQLINNSHDIIYTLSKNGDFTFVSNAWFTFLGFSPDKVIGMNFSKFVHPHDLKVCLDFLHQIGATGKGQTGVEYRVKHADGSWRWHTSDAVPIYDAAGQYVGIEGIARDITDQKFAEAALQESEERYRILVENSPVGIMLVQKGKFIYANTTGIQLLGYPSMDELVGQKVIHSIHPDSQKELFKRIKDVVRGNPNPLMEIKLIRKNGELSVTESTSSQVVINGERASLIFGQDISSRKDAEEQIRRKTADLTLIKQLNDSVNRGDSLQKSLAFLIDKTKQMFSAYGAAVYLLSPDHESLELQNYYIIPEFSNWLKEKFNLTIPRVKIKLTQASFYQQIINDKKLHYIEGKEKIISLMSEFTDNPIYRKMLPAIFKRLLINSVAAIPLIVDNESVGVLEISGTSSFTPDDLNRLDFISTELGSIIRRKQAEEALKESEEKFRQIVESSNDIFVRMNYKNLNFEYISPKVFDLLGYQQEEILAWTEEEIIRLIHPDDVSKLSGLGKDMLEAWHSGKRNLVVEHRIRTKQGEYKWFNGNFSVVIDDKNNPILIIGTLSDITERKFNELILKIRVKLMQQAPKLSTGELLVTILDEVETITGSEIGLFHFVEDDQRTVRLKAWSTNTARLSGLELAEGSILPEAELEPWRETIEKRKAIIHNDKVFLLGHKNKTVTFRELIVPIIRNDQVVSILGIANKTSDYTQSDLDLVSNLADLAWDIVENKNIEAALQESEAIFNALMENSPIYVFFRDKNLRTKQLSRNFEQFLGKPMHQLLNKRMDEIFPSDFAKEMVITDQKVLQDGESIVVDEEMNGRYYTTIKFPIYKENKPEYLAGFTIDNTDRVLSERKLAESEELYRLISSVVSDYLFSAKIDNENNLDLIWVAGAFDSMTGYSLAEYKQNGGWRAAVYAEDLEIDDCDLLHLRENRKVITEIRTVKKDGSIVWVKVYSQPIWDEEKNQLVGINGAVQDISERKRVEEKILQSAMEFEALYDTAKDFSLQQEPDEILRTITDRACSLFNVPNSFIYLFCPETEDLELKISKQQTQLKEFHIKLGKGISGKVAESLTPLIINDYGSWGEHLVEFEREKICAIMAVPMLYRGELIGVLGVNEYTPSVHTFAEEDVHFLSLFASQAAAAIYSAELFNKIRNNAAELERRVDERTQELQQKNKELETFTYTVSHDLKAPLRGISGYSSLLMEDYSEKFDEEGKKYLNNLISSTERMNQLIEDLLAYSRIERRQIKVTSINLNELIDKIMMEYYPIIDAGNLKFKKEIEYGTLFTDYEALAQVLRNILDNAVKFTRGRPCPEISIRSKKLANCCLITIEDNGIGFDMKYYDKIFEIFQRLHLADEYPGTGVGLAVVRKAVERLGGKIWAESEPGVGSKFFMELPL